MRNVRKHIKITFFFIFFFIYKILKKPTPKHLAKLVNGYFIIPIKLYLLAMQIFFMVNKLKLSDFELNVVTRITCTTDRFRF